LVLLIHPDTRVGIAEGVGGAAGWGWRKQATSVCHCEQKPKQSLDQILNNVKLQSSNDKDKSGWHLDIWI